MQNIVRNMPLIPTIIQIAQENSEQMFKSFNAVDICSDDCYNNFINNMTSLLKIL